MTLHTAVGGMKLVVSHVTEYRYPEPAHSSFNEVWMCPVDDERQTLLDFHLDVEPTTTVHSKHDFFGNQVYFVHIPGYHQSLSLRARSTVLTRPVLPPAHVPVSALTPVRDDCYEFLMATSRVPLSNSVCTTLGIEWPHPNDDLLIFVAWLTEVLKTRFVYTPESTNVSTPLADFLRMRTGVCQDYAHAMLAVLREIGIPARYTSGYIPTGTGPGGSHAWVEVYFPGSGWVGFDATAGKMVTETYAKVAHGKDYDDCPPLKGLRWGGGHESLTVDVRVTSEPG